MNLDDCLVKFCINREGEPGVLPAFAIHGGSGSADWAAGFVPYMSVRPLYGLRMTQAAVDAAKAHSDYMSGLCEHYVAAMRKVQPSGPYRIAGNSLGALLAFEMTYQLEQAGEKVERLISMDMPVNALFDKAKVFETAPSLHEKAPLLLAYRFGEMFCENKATFAADLSRFLTTLDEEILGAGSDRDKAFITMDSTVNFLKQVGMSADEVDSLRWGLINGAPLFADLRERGYKIDADVTLAISTDNRLMAHSLRVSGMSHLLDDYGWSQVTHGTVTTIPVEGDHVTMVYTEGGKAAYARCLDE